MAFDRGVVRIVNAGQAVHSFGQTPNHLGVLAWIDRGPGGSLSDHALAAQIGAVLTLSTNRRVQVAASDMTLTMEGTTQRTFVPSNLILVSSLMGPVPTDVRARFENIISSLYGLERVDRDVIGAASEMH